MSDAVDFEFKACNAVDFELVISMKTNRKIMNTIFKKSSDRLARTKGINVGGKIDDINSFEVSPAYYKILLTFLKKVIANIKEQVSSDGIDILSFAVVKAFFIRSNTDVWDIKIILGGNYVDNR